MKTVTSQTALDFFLSTNSFQYLTHGVLRSAVASELQVPQHSLVLTLLEVCEQEQVGRDTSELIFITELNQEFFTSSESYHLLKERHRLSRWH